MASNSKYYCNDSKGTKTDIYDMLLSGNTNITDGKFVNFPLTKNTNFTIEKVTNRPSGLTSFKLGYQISGTDIAASCSAKYIEITTPGTTAVPVPLWATYVAFIAIGAGGGGGVGGIGEMYVFYSDLFTFGTVGYGGGAGGGGAVIVSKSISLTSQTNISVTVGGGGNGGTTDSTRKELQSGAAGGNTTITINNITYTANGGKGGANGNNIGNNMGTNGFYYYSPTVPLFVTNSDNFTVYKADGGEGGTIQSQIDANLMYQFAGKKGSGTQVTSNNDAQAGGNGQQLDISNDANNNNYISPGAVYSGSSGGSASRSFQGISALSSPSPGGGGGGGGGCGKIIPEYSYGPPNFGIGGNGGNGGNGKVTLYFYP